MKKFLLFFALVAISLSYVRAYDFSAVAPSGQTLYYNIVNGNAQVTYQNSSSPRYSNLTGALEIPASVTCYGTTYSVTSIGNYAFDGCSGLTSVTIGNSVTSIGIAAFSGCAGLTSIIVESGNTHYDSRNNCNAIIETNTNELIAGCKNTIIPNSVTSIGDVAFYNCSGLTSVTIGNSVTSIGYAAFENCSGLTSVTIPNSVTSIGDVAFYNCSGLTSVTIGNSVTSIGSSAFQNCSGLTSVTIGNSVTSIGDWAFRSCSNVDTLYYNARNLTTTSDWVYYSSYGFRPMKLKHLVIGDSVQTLPHNVFYNQDSLTSVTIGNSVTSIGDGAFWECSGLTSVTIGNSVTTIGNYAFYECSGLTSVTIPNSVTSIGWNAFENCSGLTSVTMEGATPPTLGSDVFSWNASNRKIYVPCGAYETYYNATNGWSTYRSALSDPMVDMDVALATEAERGSVVIVPLRGQEVRCDSTVVVCATANYGYHFDHWSTGSTQAQDTIAVSGDTVITAYFAKNQYAVNVVANYSERGSVSGSDTIDYLDSITISAVANYGYHFTHWDDNDTHSVHTVLVTQNKTYTAYFDFNQYQLTVASANTVQGTCSGSGAYNYLANRTIRATANYGYHFTQWSDGNTDNPRTIQLTQDTLFTAAFAKNQYAITLLSDDASMGSVNGGGTFDYLDTIALTATATAEHHHFVRWNDGNRETPRQWVVTEDHTLTAYFAIDTHRVSVVSNNIARGMVEASGTEFVYGTPCTVTATAYSGFTFAGWSNGVTANPYTFAVINDVELTAMFISENEQMFTVTVMSNDPTMGSVSGGGMAMSGGEVTIHAVANEGYHFVRWNDNNTNADRTVTVTADVTYTAYFAANQTQGIDDVKPMAVVKVMGDCIAVEGAEGESVMIFDVMGRVIVNEPIAEGKVFRISRNGVYMVKVGNGKAQKVVVVR